MAVAIAGGLLLCLSFPPFGWWYAAILAFALLAWVLTRESTKLVGGFGYGLLFGLAFYIPLLPWTGELVGMVPWLALSVVEAVFPGLFGVLAVAVRRLPGWPLWFAALWVAQEWAKSTVPFGGFPWGVVGFSQTSGPLLPIAHIGGAPLLSFAVVLTGFSLAAIALEIVGWWQRADHARPPAVVLPGVCISVVLLTTALTSPQVRQSGAGADDDQSVTVAAVQGNVPRLGLEFNAQRRAVLDYHVRETVRLADDVRAGRAAQPMFVIWPENSSDIDPLANQDAADQISVAARAINAPILVGGVLAGPGYSSDNPVSTNSVIVWDPATGPGDRHDKQIVQPFGEYLPWRSFFSHFSPYADRAGYFVPGSGTGVVQRRRSAGRDHHVLGGDLRPRGARIGAQRRPVARGADQQRPVRRGHERATARVRQAAGRRTRPLRRGRGHHRDQRRHRARRAGAGPYGLLRTGLPRRPGPAEDAAHPGYAVGPDRRLGAGRNRCCGRYRRDHAQWRVRASRDVTGASAHSNDKGAT